jgi:hypothetical protein
VSADQVPTQPDGGLPLEAIGQQLLTLAAFAATNAAVLDVVIEKCDAAELADCLRSLSQVSSHIEAGLSVAGMTLIQHSGAAPPPELCSH